MSMRLLDMESHSLPLVLRGMTTGPQQVAITPGLCGTLQFTKFGPAKIIHVSHIETAL